MSDIECYNLMKDYVPLITESHRLSHSQKEKLLNKLSEWL